MQIVCVLPFIRRFINHLKVARRGQNQQLGLFWKANCRWRQAVVVMVLLLLRRELQTLRCLGGIPFVAGRVWGTLVYSHTRAFFSQSKNVDDVSWLRVEPIAAPSVCLPEPGCLAARVWMKGLTLV